MRTFLRDNGLTIVLVAMFLFSVLGMIWSGQAAYNEDLLHAHLASAGHQNSLGAVDGQISSVRK
jgi:hypothetical protein